MTGLRCGRGRDTQSPERVDVPLPKNQPNQPGIIFLELGLSRASPGLCCSVPAYETTSAHLCHSTATGNMTPPPPSFSLLLFLLLSFPPLSSGSSPSSLFQMQSKHQASPPHPTPPRHFRAHQHRVGAEFSSGFLGALSTLALRGADPGTCWFSPLVPGLRSRREWLNAFQIVFIWSLILSHLLSELKVFTLGPVLCVWCF